MTAATQIRLSRADAIAIIRDRIEFLNPFQHDWRQNNERKALLWILGEYTGSEQESNLRRNIYRRINHLEQRMARRRHFDIAEHAAISQMFQERLREGDYRMAFQFLAELEDAECEEGRAA